MKTMKEFKKAMQERAESARDTAKDAAKDVITANYTQAVNVLRIAELAGLLTHNEYLSVGHKQTRLTFTVDAVNGLKDKSLTGIIAFLSETVGEPSSNDYVNANWAERTIAFGTWDSAFRVDMEIQIPDGVPTCRRVKVGETAKMVAEYKIECDD